MIKEDKWNNNSYFVDNIYLKKEFLEEKKINNR